MLAAARLAGDWMSLAVAAFQLLSQYTHPLARSTIGSIAPNAIASTYRTP
jgi:hypothetical protein